MTSRPPIVFIHGMFGGAWCWENYVPLFEKAGYTCHTPALRYHDLPLAEQPHPLLGTTSVLDYIEDLRQYIQQLDKAPILIGHSMGGLLVQLLLARKAGCAGVCLTPAAPRGIVALSPSVLRSFWGILKQWQFWNKAVRLTFKEVKFGMLNRLLPADQWALYQRFGWESGRAVFEIGLWPLDARKATAITPEHVTVPVLFLGARHDRVTPIWAVRKTSQLYPNAEFVELTDHAHWVLGEPGWEAIVQKILNWLESALS